MRRLIKCAVLSSLILAAAPQLTSCGGMGKVVKCVGKNTLEVFNWGSYIDEEVIADFEKEYDVCVRYSTFDSNETAIQKLKSGEIYDVIFPSEYAVEELIAADLALPIDWSKITSMGKDDVADGVKEILQILKDGDRPFDFLKYSVPYFWGMVGIVYDTTTVSKDELIAKNWEILRDPQYTVGYYDSSRDGFIAPLKTLGYSMNTRSEKEVAEAVTWLNEQKDRMGDKISYVGDDVIEDMANRNNRYDMGVVYSGDAVYQMMNNDKLDFFKPRGTNVWLDGMVVHKKSEKVDLAYKFISYMMEDRNAERNSLYVGYSSSKQSVYQDLLRGEMRDYASAYQTEFDHDRDEVFRYDEVSRDLINDGWASAKLH